MTRPVKLDCRGVWKLYGAGAERALAGGAVPSRAELQAANIVGAVRDATVQIRPCR